MMMSKHIPAPISEGSPYMPVITYTMACPMVMIIPNTGKGQRKKICSWEDNRQSCCKTDAFYSMNTSEWASFKALHIFKASKGTWCDKILGNRAAAVGNKTYISELHWRGLCPWVCLQPQWSWHQPAAAWWGLRWQWVRYPAPSEYLEDRVCGIKRQSGSATARIVVAVKNNARRHTTVDLWLVTSDKEIMSCLITILEFSYFSFLD